MLPVADVLSRTDDLLLDADRVRWTSAERIRWMNEAMGAILTRRPAAFSITKSIALVAGTRQTIGGQMLLDVVRNIGPDPDNKPGKAIRRTDRQLLDDSDPDWHKAKPKGEIRHYTFDDRSPKEFYCYPPALAGTRVETMEAELPASVAENNEAATLGIGREYLEAVVNYVCYRCNTKDSEYASPASAIAFYQAFETALGLKGQSENAASPNQPTNSV
jgi:hypothetical protein